MAKLRCARGTVIRARRSAVMLPTRHAGPRGGGACAQMLRRAHLPLAATTAHAAVRALRVVQRTAAPRGRRVQRQEGATRIEVHLLAQHDDVGCAPCCEPRCKGARQQHRSGDGCTARRPGRQCGGGAARGRCRLYVLFYIAGCVRGALHSKGACQHGGGAGAAQCCAAKLAQLRTREPQTHVTPACALRASSPARLSVSVPAVRVVRSVRSARRCRGLAVPPQVYRL